MNFSTTHVRHMKFSEYANMNLTNLRVPKLGISLKRVYLSDKFEGTKTGDFPETWPPKFLTFKPLELDGSNFRNG